MTSEMNSSLENHSVNELESMKTNLIKGKYNKKGVLMLLLI